MRNLPKDRTIDLFFKLYEIPRSKSVAEDFFRKYLNTTPEDYIIKLKNDHSADKENRAPKNSKTRNKTNRNIPPLTPIKEENSTINITLPEATSTPAPNSKYLDSKLNKTNDESNENKFLAAAQEVLRSQKPSNLETTHSQKPFNKIAHARDVYSKIERAKAIDYRQSKPQGAVRPLAHEEEIHSQKPSNSIASSRVASERKKYGEEGRKKAQAYQLMKAQQNARPSK